MKIDEIENEIAKIEDSIKNMDAVNKLKKIINEYNRQNKCHHILLDLIKNIGKLCIDKNTEETAVKRQIRNLIIEKLNECKNV